MSIIKNKENGFLISPGDIAGMKEALLSLTKFEQRKFFGEKGREIAKNYTGEKVFPTIENLYQQ